MKYTTDGNEIKCGNIVIGRLYLGQNGYELRILQGTSRNEVIKKIIVDLPEFAANNNITENYHPKLFSK